MTSPCAPWMPIASPYGTPCSPKRTTAQRCSATPGSSPPQSLSAPLWDLSFPAQLKIYLENIFVTGIVTRYSEAGLPVGLCRAKKLYYVSTSGGPYDPRFGFDQLRAMATENFGIPEAELVKAELLDIDGCDPEAILHKAMADYGLTETTDKEDGHAT